MAYPQNSANTSHATPDDWTLFTYAAAPDGAGVLVECESGGEWAACDPTDPLSVAGAVRACGAVPRYWQGTMRAAYPVRKAVAA
ncbi:hypothetical protein [Mycobacterium aquaticum]|uniref:Uncharacterized protein n=1 Tax=Mycobacterium aquaticum TaxID=1927124 RepID=A0A1X0ABE6_9MYCO|nr:hypothetical protein [Mycobacterium aquaticum]ORA27381.1 hypothetical protein BST13_30455 [Mycobacterium aquaticum]